MLQEVKIHIFYVHIFHHGNLYKVKVDYGNPVLDNPCDVSDLSSSFQCEYDIISMYSIQHTNYLYIFMDDFWKNENENTILI